MPFRKGNKYGGKRGRLSNAALNSPTPAHGDEEDEDILMEDGDDAGTPVGEDMLDDAGTPGQDDDEEDEDGSDGPPTVTSMPRRRGRGRGNARRSMRRGDDTPDREEGDGSESGTPMRRKRGRPAGPGSARGRGGFRGRRRGQQPETPRTIVDKEGRELEVVDDEALVDFDEEGEAKVDKVGNLQGGREYRVRTFKISGRGERLYMLSTEPARCCGFRDSYLFFAKHPKLYKVLLGEGEKMNLIQRDILPSSYKGRNIGVVTARSVFREFGARIIVGGRRITDDYKVTEARAEGVMEGQLADPNDRVPSNNDEYNRNRYVAWHGASDVYRIQAGGGQQPMGKPGPVGKRRNNITLQNWQAVHSREASRFNSALTAMRRSNLDGVYDTHTNMMFYPRIMQPTHAKWEYVPMPAASNQQDKVMDKRDADSSLDLSDGNVPTSDEPDTSHSAVFPEIPPIISRNFAVIDTVFVAPPISNAGYPGPDGNVIDMTSGPNGLNSIPSDLLDELPEDCRRALEDAKAMERGWKAQWGTNQQSALRGHLKIGFNGYPV